MAFRFRLTETFEEGCQRIAREQVERAQSQLKGPDDPVVAVHETRKSLKRLRALLRLVRPALGGSVFHDENAQLREIARILSNARDRHVLFETVAKLEAVASFPKKGLGQALREALKTTNGEQSPIFEAAALRQAQARLTEAKKRFAKLHLPGPGFEVVGPGLEASYRRARRAFRSAYVELTDEAFHEWRKGTQQHWRQMLLLTRAWPASLEARANEARSLSQILGDDHDLAMLSAFLCSEACARLGEDAAVVERLARRRQQELREIAHPMGVRLFAESPKALHHSIAAYWEAAVALKDREPELETRQAPHDTTSATLATRRRRPAAGA
jgi:CHAD domain-containing protein